MIRRVRTGCLSVFLAMLLHPALTHAEPKLDAMFATVCGSAAAIPRFVEPIYVRFSLVADIPDFSKKTLDWEIEKFRERSKIDIFFEPSERSRRSQIDLMLLPQSLAELSDQDLKAIVRAIEDGAQRANVRTEMADASKVTAALKDLYGSKNTELALTAAKQGERIYSLALVRSTLFGALPETQVVAALTELLGDFRGRVAQEGSFPRALRDDASTAEMTALDYTFFEQLYANKRPGPYRCDAR